MVARRNIMKFQNQETEEKNRILQHQEVNHSKEVHMNRFRDTKNHSLCDIHEENSNLQTAAKVLQQSVANMEAKDQVWNIKKMKTRLSRSTAILSTI